MTAGLAVALVAASLGASAPASAAQTVQWVTQFGTADYDVGSDVAVDSAGNTYVVGGTFGDLHGASAGHSDAFVAKYDPSGAQQWVRQFGTDVADAAYGVSVDSTDNVYLTGTTRGDLSGVSAGGQDVFVAKYDTAGVQQWLIQLGTDVDEFASGIAVDSADNVYLSGSTAGAFPGHIAAGHGDAFVAKYNSSGTQQWVSQFGTDTGDGAFGAAVDSADNVYLSGTTKGAFPGHTSAGGDDAFVAKYNSSGTQVWVTQFGTGATDSASGVAVDSADNVYLSGRTYGSFPGYAVAGIVDAFVAKYDVSGVQQWVSQLGTDNVDAAFSVDVDSVDNVYLVGSTYGAFPGRTSAGDTDVFVASYDTSGSQQWVSQFGTASRDEATDVAVDPGDDVFLAGQTFGAFPGSLSAGGPDAFVTKLSNGAPLVDAGSDVSGGEGSAIALDGAVSDPDTADTVTTTWTYLADVGVDSGVSCSFADASALDTTITCTDDGTFTAILTASDGVNLEVTDSTTVTVGNVAASITSISAPVDPVAVDTPVNVSAAFADPGANDTHTCTMDWGDGSGPAGATVSGDDCAGSHSYTAAGVYRLTATVTDDDGASDSEIFEYVVVYDPDAGFVTGGGWIDSPAGAYTGDDTIVGKASFGFVSRYKKGTTIPDGNTQFQFHAAGLEFQSTVYEWLVIAGPKAQYKGSGTIGGAGDYGFMITANDGQQAGGGDVDRFRIKIWDNTDGTVVYDNQRGDNDGAAASGAIVGGSIVIHTKR